MSELTRREEVDYPLLNIIYSHVESWGDNTALVKTSIEFNNNLVGTVIIDNFEFTDVSFGLSIGTQMWRKKKVSAMPTKMYIKILRELVTRFSRSKGSIFHGIKEDP